jgi:catechol 2,3-dioxygenase-like lactoylglutathione lyase family enzyme
MIIDHVGMIVTDYEKSKKFYTLILAPLGIKPLTQHEEWISFGKTDKPEFWFGPDKKIQQFTHIAFKADTEEAIQEFYRIAIQEGATCNGKPKLRNDYYANYYSAFIIDYDGHNIGAILHKESK